MKRGRLERHTELRRGEGPKANPETTRRWQRRSAQLLPPTSERRQAERPARKDLRRRVLGQRRLCEAKLAWCCTGIATEVNELQRGPGRATTYLDDDKVTALCGECHRWLTGHPSWATRHGHQVDHEGRADFEKAALIRLQQRFRPCPETCERDHREAW